MGSRRRGREKGGYNKGYWFRKGRGWYVTGDNRSPTPLCDESGRHLKDPSAEPLVKDAYARWLIGLQQEAQRKANADKTLLMKICRDYFAHSKATDRPSTYIKRAEFLFDFCTGLPARFWNSAEKKKKAASPKEKDRLHHGHGKKPVGELIPLDVQQWLDVHKGWEQGTRRMAVQALKRALNYAKDMGIITRNPIRGYKVGRGGRRVTYFTPETEAKLYEHANRALALAIRVCIRTGARYGAEFCKLTSKHVEETAKGMIWRFGPKESKNHKERIVYVAPEIADIVRGLLKKYPPGQPLFRNSIGQPWTMAAIRRAFHRLRRKLTASGIKLDDAGCMYTCRHTFAKRTLGGYWTAKPCTIEQLCKAMGNSRQVCWDHYAQWSNDYVDPIWEAINGKPIETNQSAITEAVSPAIPN